MHIEFLGATREVTGSCHLIQIGDRRLLVECGLFQGSAAREGRNRDAFPFDPATLDAVVLTHAHIDHSGRLPLLVKQGYAGPVYTHAATTDLCGIMLEDSGYLQEKEALWENRKRERKGLELIEPLYTQEDARKVNEHFVALPYGEEREILPGVTLILHDAGHILGSAIVELRLKEGGRSRTVVFSGDLGHRGAPILHDPQTVPHADLVIMESTYGDRAHRGWESTWEEMGGILNKTHSAEGNILIPAFTVGRTQELLYMFHRNFEAWGIGKWQIFLDSPMAIQATSVYARHANLFDAETAAFLSDEGSPFALPNLRLSQSSADSMRINRISSGAIIIAGSGMCTGGRIKHHLKHNIWRREAHVMIVGFQARGTLGRQLVDGRQRVRLWGESMQVKASIHTIGGLSAHADQQGLMDWYGAFQNRPPVALVHGESDAMSVFAERLKTELGARVTRPSYGKRVEL